MIEQAGQSIDGYSDLNNFYKKLLNEVPDLIFQLEIASDKDFKFLFVSPAIKELYELEVEDVKRDASLVLEKRILAEDYMPFLHSILKAKVDLKPWSNEFKAMLPKKGVRWFLGSAKPERMEDGRVIFYGRIADVTEKKEQELKLKISEERFQFALDANEQGVWDWDLVTNKVYYSLQSRMILEIGVEEKADSPEVWDERIHPDDKVAYFTDIQKHFENITPYYQNYHRVLSKSGEYKWILDRGKVVLRDELGKPLRIIGTHNDISAQKIKEDELIKTLGIVSEQNTRLLNFAHIVSHNLRSHAGNFKMLLDLIESAENREEEQVTLLHLRTISNELSETIEHLNELVGIHSELKPVKESLNLHDYFRKTLNILGEEINKHKVIIHDEIPGDIHVQYNPAYLESVLLNFTTNAIKYSHPERHPEIRFKCGEEQRRYVLEITDNGLGIDLERHGESLFGMYKTFHKHPNSRGIGLFITKNQIEAMGGEIEVKSIVGEGTVFKIYFNNEEI